jgi:hypothetical protein
MIPAWRPVRVSWLDRGLALAAGLALLASLAVWWRARRELDEVRQRLEAVTAANVFLKKTLGEMTIAMTAKDREIDRLAQAPCGAKEKARPGSERSTNRKALLLRNPQTYTTGRPEIARSID